MKLFMISWCLGVSCLLVPTWARGDETNIARFRREYPPAAKRLADANTRVRGSGQITVLGAGQVPSVKDFRFATDHGYRKLELSRVGEEASSSRTSYVACLWADSGYELRWSKKTLAYQVSHAGPVDAKRTPRISYNIQFGRFLAAAFSVCNIDLREAIERESTKVLAADPVFLGGHECLRVKLKTFLGQDKPLVFEITADVDPSRGWIVLGGQSQTGPFPPQRQDIIYSDQTAERFQIREVAINEEFDPSLPESQATRWRCRFDTIEDRSTPIEEFSMNHYGVTPIVGPGSGEELAAARTGNIGLTRIAVTATFGLLGIVALWYSGKRVVKKAWGLDA